MRKVLLILLIFIFSKNVYADYIVISNGVIIEGENIDHVQSVASISKIMTALVALEKGDITDKIVITKEVSEQIGSSLYLQVNESYSLLSLIHGLLLRSGNDAAYAIAMHVGGSIEGFVELMDDKAKEIGMNDTIFRNPSGLDEFDGGNQSTVYDMALCMQEAMKNDIFRIIINTKQYKAEHNRIWTNKNRLLFMYEYCNGGKTGYTTKSGKTLITSANYNGFETFVVSFKEYDYFNLHKKLHERVYDEYESIVLIEKGNYTIGNKKLYVDEDIRTIVKKDEKVQYSIKIDKNEIVVISNQNERRIQIDTILE